MKIRSLGIEVVLENEEELRHLRHAIYVCHNLSNESIRIGCTQPTLVRAGIGPDTHDLRKFNEFVSRISDEL